MYITEHTTYSTHAQRNQTLNHFVFFPWFQHIHFGTATKRTLALHRSAHLQRSHVMMRDDAMTPCARLVRTLHDT